MEGEVSGSFPGKSMYWEVWRVLSEEMSQEERKDFLTSYEFVGSIYT
jgi:hypothetical protein